MESTFNSLVGDLDYPMFIVTACADGERSGCLIGFATQASIDPSRFLVCLSHKNRTYRVAQGAELLGVHFVPEEQAELAELFGGETGDEVDKFARVRVGAGPGRHAAARRLPEPLRRPRARAARRRRPRRDPARAGAGGAREPTPASSASTARSGSSPGTRPERGDEVSAACVLPAAQPREWERAVDRERHPVLGPWKTRSSWRR